jgi:hypothetical protein
VRKPLRNGWRALAASLVFATIAACGGGGGDNGGGGGPLNITTATADDGMIGTEYSERIVASGGRGAKTFSISAGALPAGLTLSAAGTLSGTPAGPAGTANFTVSVSDSAATPATDTQALSIEIVEPLAIATASVPATAVGDLYNAVIAFEGGTPPYQVSTAGEIPSGVGLQLDGTLTGTVAADARTGTFDVTLTDSSSPAFSVTRSYTMRVALDITTAALADANGGIAYSDGVVAQGGLPPFSWSLTAGTLPAGLSGPDAATGIISGTPQAACAPATSSLTFRVTDSDSPAVTDTRAGIDLTVSPAALTITTATLPNGTIGAAYDHRIIATGGSPPYAFALTGGSLPSQLALAATGRITGTPDTVETQAFQVTVTDGCAVSTIQNYSITVSTVSLGRNDSPATATTLPGNGTYQASISPSGDPNTVFDPDEDYYRITTTATSTVTVDINAQVNGSPLDSVIELVNAGGSVLNQCVGPAFTSQCVSDDEVLGVQLDSSLQLRVTGASTFYIHVVDWGSNARPDKLYDLVISGVN